MSASSSAPVPHLFTLTGNLLAERTLEFDTWSAGRTQRAAAESFQVGGKGINVSKMLTRLQTANTALCFAGGAAGAECRAWLAERGFTHRAFPTTAPTRSGVVIRDRNNTAAETTFLGTDRAPDPAALQACAEFLDAQPDGQVLALCGSFPGWNETTCAPLRAALERWAARGHLVADTYGPPLAWAVARPLALIKVNADEIRSLGGVDPFDTGRPTVVRRWVVTDGPGAVKVRDETDEVTSLLPPQVKEVSPTGSGDVLLAAILHALFVRRFSLIDTVKFSLPYAAANAAHHGVAEFTEPT